MDSGNPSQCTRNRDQVLRSRPSRDWQLPQVRRPPEPERPAGQFARTGRAPRPEFVGAGATNGDGWVDAKGMFLAAAGAGPVYKLLGKKDMGTTEFPPIETPLVDGEVAFRQHGGGHTPGPNWPTFLAFADRYIKGPPRAGTTQSATSPR